MQLKERKTIYRRKLDVFKLNTEGDIVELYVQQDKLFIKFINRCFCTLVQTDEYHNKATNSPDVFIHNINPIATSFSYSTMMKILSDSEGLVSHEPGYVNKRYIFDSEDLVSVEPSKITPGCIVRIDKVCYLVIQVPQSPQSSTGEQSIQLLNLENEDHLHYNISKSDDSVEVYRCKSLKLAEDFK